MDLQVPHRQGGAASCTGLSSQVRWRPRSAARTVLVSVGWGVLILCVLVAVLGATTLVAGRGYPVGAAQIQPGLLALQASIAVAITGSMVYLSTRGKERRLFARVDRLIKLIEAYQENPSAHGRFNNPSLVHCRQVVGCSRTECPMHDMRGERCWQVMALTRATEDLHSRSVEIGECHKCVVYRMSCPDRLTQLGESFNNLMFLLERDAQQLMRMRAQMVEKEKMVAIGQMAAGVADEVANPLASISSVLQMQKRDHAGVVGLEYLDLIESNVRRIAHIVRQLAHVSRPALERWERVDVGESLAKVVELIHVDKRARGVEIVFEPPKSRLSSYALREQLQQVFINVSLNALDAMPDGGMLTIRARQEHHNIIVVIKDTGCGIPREIGRRVFDPFFTTKEPGSGSGLGLAVSYGVIQKHGGMIDFRAVGESGTEFTISFPIMDRPPNTEYRAGHHS